MKKRNKFMISLFELLGIKPDKKEEPEKAPLTEDNKRNDNSNKEREYETLSTSLKEENTLEENANSLFEKDNISATDIYEYEFNKPKNSNKMNRVLKVAKMISNSQDFKDMCIPVNTLPGAKYFIDTVQNEFDINVDYPDETICNLAMNRFKTEIDIWKVFGMNINDIPVDQLAEIEKMKTQNILKEELLATATESDGDVCEDIDNDTRSIYATENCDINNNETPDNNSDDSNVFNTEDRNEENPKESIENNEMDPPPFPEPEPPKVYDTVDDILKETLDHPYTYKGSYKSLDEIGEFYPNEDENIKESPRVGDIITIDNEESTATNYMYNGAEFLELSRLELGGFDDYDLTQTPDETIKIPVIMITGKGGCGKDTIISKLDSHIFAINISSITPIKEALSKLGVDPDDKSDATRLMMHQLKMLSQEHNDYPNTYCLNQINYYWDNLKTFIYTDPNIANLFPDADILKDAQNEPNGFWFPVIFLQIREAESRRAFEKIFKEDENATNHFALYSCLVTRDVTDEKFYGNHCDDDADDDVFDFVIRNDNLDEGIAQMNTAILDIYLAQRWGTGKYKDDMGFDPYINFGIFRNQFIDGWKYHRVRFEEYNHYMQQYLTEHEHFINLQAELKYRDANPMPSMFPFDFGMPPMDPPPPPVDDNEIVDTENEAENEAIEEGTPDETSPELPAAEDNSEETPIEE